MAALEEINFIYKLDQKCGLIQRIVIETFDSINSFALEANQKARKNALFFQRYLQIDMGSYFQKGSISK